MGRIRVGLVFGEKSAEHEVSLQSARNIVEALDQTRFDVSLVGVDKWGQRPLGVDLPRHAEDTALRRSVGPVA